MLTSSGSEGAALGRKKRAVALLVSWAAQLAVRLMLVLCDQK